MTGSVDQRRRDLASPPLPSLIDRIPELRRVVAGATQGEWHKCQGSGHHWVDIDAPEGPFPRSTVAGPKRKEDADHIATFDPPLVSALLDTIEALVRERDEARDMFRQWVATADKYAETQLATLTTENARLTAELAEVREQLNASPGDVQFWLARIKVGNDFLFEAETRVAELEGELARARALTDGGQP